jgi:hypothetical protein
LREREPAELLDTLDPGAAVASGAREDDADRAVFWSSASESKKVSTGRRAARRSLGSARWSTPSRIVTSLLGRIM